MYKLLPKTPLSTQEFILRIDGDRFTYIPLSTDNIDYRAYLKWLEEGNTPLPADAE